MTNYDFLNLSPIDFEILVRDLLQAEIGITLESFKPGKDQGIDFRYAPSLDNATIIQCKRYSEYDSMLQKCKSDEAVKVGNLKPNRYIFSTSVPLNPMQKNEIFDVFKPFIKSTGDIYGKDDLNNLLGKHNNIHRQHFKLWLTDVHILEDIFHSRCINVSRDSLRRIQHDAQIYVKNQSFEDARRILEDFNFCIIAGLPGIGKTMLAEMLTLHYADRGYELVKIESDISEASQVDHANVRRIYFYDDFLGQTSSAEKMNKNEDQKLLDFIEAIRTAKTSKIILTTREYILNQTRSRYEKIQRAKFDLQTYIIELNKYTRKNRAEILFNHMYYSEIPKNYIEALLFSKRYKWIVDHINYNPRIISYMLKDEWLKGIDENKYVSFFISNLNNPKSIWKHAFESQLSIASQNLLTCLATMPDKVLLTSMETAFDAFHHCIADRYNILISPNDFKNALHELDGNFVATEKSFGEITIKFHNPSIRDFITQYIVEHPAYLKGLLESCVYHDQISTLWGHGRGSEGKSIFRDQLMPFLDILIRSIRKTIDAPSCRIVLMKAGNSKKYSTLSTSLSKRANIIASIVAVTQNVEAIALMNEVIKNIEQQIEREIPIKWDLSGFISELNDLGLVEMEKHSVFLNKAKSYFLKEAFFIDQVDYFCDFEELFPQLVTEDDKTAARKLLVDTASNIIWEHHDDPGNLRNEAEDLEKISKRMGIEMTEEKEKLIQMAEELESELPQEPDDDERYGMSGATDFFPDSELDSMFITLRQNK